MGGYAPPVKKGAAPRRAGGSVFGLSTGGPARETRGDYGPAPWSHFAPAPWAPFVPQLGLGTETRVYRRVAPTVATGRSEGESADKSARAGDERSTVSDFDRDVAEAPAAVSGIATPPDPPAAGVGLKVSSPSDAAESEADAMAAMALAAPRAVSESAPSIPADTTRVHRKCRQCEDEDQNDHQGGPSGAIQRRGEGTPVVTGRIAASVSALSAGGDPLQSDERRFFEDRFGYDLSRVRVHADRSAAEASRALNAEAFTLQNDIAFAEGRYQPGTTAGRRLVAHELAHVIQQGQAAPLAGAGGTARSVPASGVARIARQESGAAAASSAPMAAAPAPRSADVSAGENGGGGELIVDDETTTLATGQQRKTAFLAALRMAVCAAADQALARAGRDTPGCPYIERWLGHYAGKPASHLERGVRKLAPGAGAARSANDYVPLVAARIAKGVDTWVVTGKIPADIPDELRTELPTGSGGLSSALGGLLSSVVGAVGGALSGIGRLFFKGAPGGPRLGADPEALAARLGAGRPIEGSARARMETALGGSFEAVRIHDDVGAAGLTRDLGAHAFTLGTHVAFADGNYRPGTPVGDALLAHELAHVVQQSGTPGGERVAPAGEVAPPDQAVEQDADRAAAGAVAALYAPEHAPGARHPQLRHGIRLSRCGGAPPQPQTQVGPSNANAQSPAPDQTQGPAQTPAAPKLTAIDDIVIPKLKAAYCRTQNSNPGGTGFEFCGLVVRDTTTGALRVTEPGGQSQTAECAANVNVRSTERVVAYYHSHPFVQAPLGQGDANKDFSVQGSMGMGSRMGDRQESFDSQRIYYLINAAGEVKRFDPLPNVPENIGSANVGRTTSLGNQKPNC